MASKHLKTCLFLLAIRKISVEVTVRHTCVTSEDEMTKGKDGYHRNFSTVTVYAKVFETEWAVF